MEEKTSEETKILLREKQTELIKIIEAFSKIHETEEWQSVKELVFDRSVASIERQILIESLTKEINVNKLYKLQGEWAWAKQYSDIGQFVSTLKKQLTEIKKKLHE